MGNLQKTQWKVHEAEHAHVLDAIWDGFQTVLSATCADALHLGAGLLCFALSSDPRPNSPITFVFCPHIFVFLPVVVDVVSRLSS